MTDSPELFSSSGLSGSKPYSPWYIYLIKRSMSSFSCAIKSNSLIYPLEKIVAIDRYWASFDFRLIRSPSGDTSSTVPLHWSTTSKNFSSLHQLCSGSSRQFLLFVVLFQIWKSLVNLLTYMIISKYQPLHNYNIR